MDMKKNLIGREELTYWKSLGDKANNPVTLKSKQNEFLNEIVEGERFEPKSGLSRRKFLAISAATTALAATACSDYRDKGEIVSYNKKPESVLPGMADYYASTCTACSLNCGVLIKTRAGRPIKIDGNPAHPINKGKICSTGQASLMELYSPERIKNPVKKKGGDLILFRDDMTKEKWSVINDDIIKALDKAKSSSKQVALIAGPVTSPTQKKLFDEFQVKYPNATIYSYKLMNCANRVKAWEAAYGNRNVPLIKWNQADLILTFEADILGNESHFVENIRLFATRRNVNQVDKFNRLYSVEGKLSLTGMNADYRLRLNPIAHYDFIMALVNEIVNVRKFNVAQISVEDASEARKYNLGTVVSANGMNIKIANLLVDDLIRNAGKSIAYAGDAQSASVHAAVNILNDILGNNALYNSEQGTKLLMPLSSKEDIETLVAGMKAGMVDIVINYDTNPVFELPIDYKYKEALKKVTNIVTLTQTANETTQYSNYILPIHHDFESWGDYQNRTGIISLQQPVINPLYDNRQKEAILLTWLNGDAKGYNSNIYHEYLMKNWETNIHPAVNSGTDFRTFWYASLHEGVIEFKEPVSEQPIVTSSISKKAILKSTAIKGYTLMLSNNYSIGADGRYANNGWLQELPHPITKVNWDNYAMISPKTAKELNVDFDDTIDVKVNGKLVNLPIVLQPGLADKLLVVELGYGRIHTGDIGKSVGVNVNALITKNASYSPFIYSNVLVSKGERTCRLASTQEHHMLDDLSIKDIHKDRHIIQEGTVEKYKKNPDFLKGKHHGEQISLYPPHEYKGVKWAMAVDMNKCVGCAACVTGCNVENNIPIVGREQTMKGREMHWIRIDRYYSGTEEDPEVSNQPMLCQHCDNAPCENVCPVVATNHSPDGLNQMVYNRCVGTRYCSNNCPYKVRRYNFFDYRDEVKSSYQKKDSFELMHNPEVTIRARGVMEKCTFCVQRIMDARQEATKAGREIKGSDVRTACQDACPADAITFGDMNDKKSDISEIREHKLGYSVLEELNVKPNVTYVARLRNKISEDK